MMRFGSCTVLLLGALFAVVAQPAGAQDEPTTAAGMDARTHNLWQRHWRRFAMKTIAFEGDYVTMPLWEPRHPSSHPFTVETYRKAKTVVLRQKFSGVMMRPIEIVPPLEDGRIAAMTIPELAPGHYGHIHSFEVVEILGPEEMLIQNVWLVDAAEMTKARDAYKEDLSRKLDQSLASEMTQKMFEAREAAATTQRDRRFRTELRLVGFPTDEVIPEERWPGKGEDLPIAIAVVGEEAKGSSGRFRSRRQRLVAVAAQRFHHTVDESQFIDMLSKRGLTPTEFVELVTTAYRNERGTEAADETVFRDLARRQRAQVEAQREAEEAADGKR